MTDLETSARDWSADLSDGERAAVELVIWKGLLRRRDFTSACVHQTPAGSTWVDWPSAHRFAMTAAMSGSERTTIDVAAKLAQGQLLPAGTAELGDVHRRAVADAVSRALGIKPGTPPPGPALNFAEAYDVGEARRLAGLPGLGNAAGQHVAYILGHLVDIVDRIAPQEPSRD